MWTIRHRGFWIHGYAPNLDGTIGTAGYRPDYKFGPRECQVQRPDGSDLGTFRSLRAAKLAIARAIKESV